MEVAEKRFAARDPLGVAFVAVLRNFLIGGWRESFGGPQQDLPRLHGPLLRLVRTKIGDDRMRSEEHTSELQSLMRISSAVFCLKKNIHNHILQSNTDCKLQS